MERRNSSQIHLSKLSSSRVSNRKSLFTNPSNLTSTMFGQKNNIVMTYSKSRPIQIVKKKHFHTPDTPQVFTPEELQTTEENRDTETKKTNLHSQGGSYTSGKTLQSLNSTSLQLAEKLHGNTFTSTRPGNSTTKSTRQGSSLALRNISNIPIEKTLSRTQCTPNRNNIQRRYQEKSSESSKKSVKTTSLGCSKIKRKELPEKSIKLKNVNEKEEKQEQVKSKEKKNNSTDSKSGSLQSKSATNYSAKSMSTCTTTSSRGESKQGHTCTAQSMSLCHSTLMNEQNIGQKPAALEILDDLILLPKNSTFNDSGAKVMVQDFFSNFVSPNTEINNEETSQTMKPSESPEKEVNANKSTKFQNQVPDPEVQSCQSHEHNNSNDGPKTSTPTDQGKIAVAPEVPVDLSPILKISDCMKDRTHFNFINKKQIQVKKVNIANISKRNTLVTVVGNKSAVSEHEIKPKKYKETRPQKHSQSLRPENDKTSLPLQASICIEDESDQEQIQDNVTPEVVESNKSCHSSSKRRLEYNNPLIRPDKDVCLLLDFNCTKKKPCKIWMRKENLSDTINSQNVPRELLAII